MKVIIAEKPSLARNIVSAITNMKQKGGYYEGNGYIVTWAFGHLFSLADIETYNPAPEGTNGWTMKNLPCFPEKFKFELKKDKNKNIDPGVKKQFEIIKYLCSRSDVDTVINAGDSDREGEIIVRIITENACIEGKSFKRLWLPDQTNETILSSLGDMKDESEYDNLANEGFARTYIDWLYGVNLTRFATLKTGTLLRVGRVIVPIVKAIYDRDTAIENFVPDIYYAVSSKSEVNGEKIELTSKKKFDKNSYDKAKALCSEFNRHRAVVTGKKEKKDNPSPPKLFSLTKLQNVLGKKHKMPMEKSLAIVQSLYERGFVTYPRTNSESLATAEQDKIKKIIAVVKKIGYPVEFKFKKTIFDDKKIESHSALTPTFKIPDKEALSGDEFIVYSTIMRRFASVFCSEECVAKKTEININVGNIEDFTIRGTVILKEGWMKFDDRTSKNKTLPNLEKGDEFEVNFEPAEKETTPPKHYTIETLNNYLKNPFRDDKANDENDDEDYRAIFEGLELGTEATRTGIIDNARKSEYILLKKDVYTILPAGKNLINSLMRMNISMDKYKTSQLGQALKKVYRGEINIDDSIKMAQDEIKSVFCVEKLPPEKDVDDGFLGDVAGKCPVCGNDVVRTRFGYGCTGYKDGCKFTISNIICQRVISLSNVKKLLSTGKTYKIENFVSKNGKNFSGYLKLEGNRAVFDFND